MTVEEQLPAGHALITTKKDNATFGVAFLLGQLTVLTQDTTSRNKRKSVRKQTRRYKGTAQPLEQLPFSLRGPLNSFRVRGKCADGFGISLNTDACLILRRATFTDLCHVKNLLVGDPMAQKRRKTLKHQKSAAQSKKGFLAETLMPTSTY